MHMPFPRALSIRTLEMTTYSMPQDSASHGRADAWLGQRLLGIALFHTVWSFLLSGFKALYSSALRPRIL